MQAISTNNTLVFSRSFTTLALITAWAFLFCYFGERLTSHFQSLSDEIYDCNWHEFPIELKKCLISMLTIAQKPIYLRGFAQFRCSHEIFASV